MGNSLIDLPVKLIMPASFNNIKELALKTIPSATKPEIRSVLQSMYGLEVEKIRTLNMLGKTKRVKGRLVARPNYKKAYVSLKHPISIETDFDHASLNEEQRMN
ncbi:hypothetical protein ACFE04_004670 [Oxalis oulophora]